MRKFLLAIIFLSLVLLFVYQLSMVWTPAYAKTQIPKTEQVSKVMSVMIPDIKVLSVEQSPIEGLWEVAFESRGKKNIAYLDHSYKYLIGGNIFSISTRTNLTQEKFQQINKVDLSLIPYENALVLGDKNAKHKVVVFDDPDWPYCGKLHQEMEKVIEQRKDIAFYILLYPLPFHKDAYRKSKAIFCEKSMEMLVDAFAKKPVPDPKCETTVIDENINLAKKFGINGTPALILSDGVIMTGARDAKSLIQLIDKK